MITEIKTYWCDRIPEKSDIKEAIDIIGNRDFVIDLKWFVQYSGTYSVTITKDCTVESVIAQMPECYPV